MEIARWFIAVVALFNFGGFVADAVVPATAKQHLWNPRWPPHAKFHNAQTMNLGFLNGGLALFFLFGFAPLTHQPLTLPLFLIAAMLAGNYFLAMVLAPLYPGTDWIDPEFKADTPYPLGLAPQQLVSYVLCGLIVIGVVIAVSNH